MPRKHAAPGHLLANRNLTPPAMFQRMHVEDWAIWCPYISFSIFAVLFAIVSYRALRLSEAKRNHLASMPLDPTPDTPKQP